MHVSSVALSQHDSGWGVQTEPPHRRLRPIAIDTMGDNRFVRPALLRLPVLTHVLLAERVVGCQLIVRSAQYAQVVSRVRATPGERPDMIDLEPLGFRASLAVCADIRAAAAVSHEHAIP